jgi:hypothetical protein
MENVGRRLRQSLMIQEGTLESKQYDERRARLQEVKRD